MDENGPFSSMTYADLAVCNSLKAPKSNTIFQMITRDNGVIFPAQLTKL